MNLSFPLKTYYQTEHLFSLCLSNVTVTVQWEEPVELLGWLWEGHREPSQRASRHNALKTSRLVSSPHPLNPAAAALPGPLFSS